MSQPNDDGTRTISVAWQLEQGPAPLVNQFALQGTVDADGGPGEIVVSAGYVAPPIFTGDPSETSDAPLSLPVTNVARFSLTRHRAEQLIGFLREQVDQWDRGDAAVRKGGEK
ncbi:hypothetical protein HQ346_12830 [Rhodococcus sp. BP-252]|uniref:hypothetical protein n=1 Tax=unclassified Rhodococcus (in: high G+C Gram-positive bacteria) TaxID=192944 RepID=UPI001C9A5EA0|nr:MULTISPECIES: hypothetical protein [unclassified Rhodococcus (in: high G+C Gram-positive bacteria)]MBY6411709.1 hypothetical protein [Rhodococcus sp. BP-320]MBY6417306.1 hypothetical protein [Rhodococcus sp. BP-321]MBY6421909.1 hypothetical protein [Rhodococcus sp. BP-324]MBY6427330.1 hypothetical protein [Rhodococcus sp. BP-323]MBY6432527.1 hypothetical protein [Rhodococcus sp. BP-322]